MLELERRGYLEMAVNVGCGYCHKSISLAVPTIGPPQPAICVDCGEDRNRIAETAMAQLLVSPSFAFTVLPVDLADYAYRVGDAMMTRRRTQ